MVDRNWTMPSLGPVVTWTEEEGRRLTELVLPRVFLRLLVGLGASSRALRLTTGSLPSPQEPSTRSSTSATGRKKRTPSLCAKKQTDSFNPALAIVPIIVVRSSSRNTGNAKLRIHSFASSIVSTARTSRHPGCFEASPSPSPTCYMSSEGGAGVQARASC